MAVQKTIKKKMKNPFANIFVFPMSSRRQFRRLMVGITVMFVAVVSFHIYFLMRIQQQDVFQVAPAASVNPGQTVNEKKLTSVLQRYEDKANVRAAALSLTPVISEPSQ